MTQSMGISPFSLARPAVWAVLPVALVLTVTGVEASLPSRLAAASDAELTAELATAEGNLMRFEIAEEVARRDTNRFSRFVGRRAAGLVFVRAGDDRRPALTALVVGTAEHSLPTPRERGA